jgi:hypothetical protein
MTSPAADGILGKPQQNPRLLTGIADVHITGSRQWLAPGDWRVVSVEIASFGANR